MWTHLRGSRTFRQLVLRALCRGLLALEVAREPKQDFWKESFLEPPSHPSELTAASPGVPSASHLGRVPRLLGHMTLFFFVDPLMCLFNSSNTFLEKGTWEARFLRTGVFENAFPCVSRNLKNS